MLNAWCLLLSSFFLSLSVLPPWSSYRRFTEDEHVLEEDVCEFPMAVLEVKLGGAAAADPPDWIKSLTRENGPCILENSFSK